jgi:hypothetical protein
MSSVETTLTSASLDALPARPVSSSAEDSSATESQGTDTPSVLIAVPKFESPQLRVDPVLNTVILEYRDAQSGEELRQVPSKAQLKLYQLHQEQFKAADQAAAEAKHT